MITSRPIWSKNKNNNNKCKKFEFLIVDKLCQVTAEVRWLNKLTQKNIVTDLNRQILYRDKVFQGGLIFLLIYRKILIKTEQNIISCIDALGLDISNFVLALFLATAV